MSVTITRDSLFQHYFYLDDKTTPLEFNCPIKFFDLIIKLFVKGKIRDRFGAQRAVKCSWVAKGGMLKL